MLFKTRVGLCKVDGTFEIVAHRSEPAGTWRIYAHGTDGDVRIRSLFKAFEVSGGWTHLAAFDDGPEVEAEVGRAMSAIADAMASAATICDLSRCGSAGAWAAQWKQIRWP